MDSLLFFNHGFFNEFPNPIGQTEIESNIFENSSISDSEFDQSVNMQYSMIT